MVPPSPFITPGTMAKFVLEPTMEMQDSLAQEKLCVWPLLPAISPATVRVIVDPLLAEIGGEKLKVSTTLVYACEIGVMAGGWSALPAYTPKLEILFWMLTAEVLWTRASLVMSMSSTADPAFTVSVKNL